ncbi:endonuclease domain-containing protein [Mycoplasmopsis arginini]|uniref:endonuclease domain-containing protein n=1 Tax=Mycoplasmopsis arginini TaxID=2094 RepID=UPI0034DD9230
MDHRHKANEPKVGRKCEREAVRGLLCGNCNRFLGMIQDNKSLLQNLVNYLKQHGDYWYGCWYTKLGQWAFSEE